MTVANAADVTRTVADPNAEYLSMRDIWDRNRAVCGGERYVKALDQRLSPSMQNMLIPFSPSMTQPQYDFYRLEAELPGIVSQFSKMLVGGLLRKTPVLTLPDDMPEGVREEAHDWIMNSFTQDNSSITSFLDTALWEEIQTGRAWVYVDYPFVEDADSLTNADFRELAPFPILWKPEEIVNWKLGKDEKGNAVLKQIIVRTLVEQYGDTEDTEFHPTFKDTVYVHELDSVGYYQIRVFERADDVQDAPVVNGNPYKKQSDSKVAFPLVDTITGIKANGERLTRIPAWPLNGSMKITDPIISAIVDKEISLYNKISRRNHLLYGAATYTPVIFSDMGEKEFDEIVASGLGSWLRLPMEAKVEVLKTPTDALKDMEKAIASAIEEMARLGIRMLSPETAQSGIALEIRNAAQTAQLGSLNNKVSAIMSKIIAFMLNWRYDLELTDSDVEFDLSSDFNPIPLGADWIRLATEWYENGLLPRSVWLQILKQNDIVSPDYDDEDGQTEIIEDDLIQGQAKAENEDIQDQLDKELEDEDLDA
ncbi:MAG: DUF4055 domain-containing protein [Gammaproteobacteria bacterium]|nr:DUF4055 domain-containing protein [Gammaproteobacteria bacterium]